MHDRHARLPPNCENNDFGNRFARLCFGSWAVVIHATFALRWQQGSLTGREATEFKTSCLQLARVRCVDRHGHTVRPRDGGPLDGLFLVLHTALLLAPRCESTCDFRNRHCEWCVLRQLWVSKQWSHDAVVELR